jgi:hypothetical protein
MASPYHLRMANAALEMRHCQCSAWTRLFCLLFKRRIIIMCIHPSIHPSIHHVSSSCCTATGASRTVAPALACATGLKDLVCAWNSLESPTRNRPWPGAGWNGYKGPGLEDVMFKNIKFYLYDDGPNDMRAAEACMRVSGTCPLDTCVRQI